MSPPPRLFVTAELKPDQRISMGEDHTNYLTRVLRREAGASVRLFNGQDGEWRGTLEAIGKRTCQVALVEQTRPQVVTPDVWLAFAPLKKARTDFVIEKATELGAARLCPVITEYTNTERVRTDRLDHLVIEAAEQTERLDVPVIDEPKLFRNWLAEWPADRPLVFADELTAGQSPQNALTVLSSLSERPMALLVGPEGGFSPSERASLQAHKGVITVSLGPRILRAETAAIALLTLWQSTHGDWASTSLD